jgi:hypothetical protein
VLCKNKNPPSPIVRIADAVLIWPIDGTSQTCKIRLSSKDCQPLMKKLPENIACSLELRLPILLP